MKGVEAECRSKGLQPFDLMGDGVARLRVAGGVAESRQVGNDHPVLPRQQAGDAGEVVLVAAEAVHQHQRLAPAAFEVRHLDAAGQPLALQRQSRASALQRQPQARHALRCEVLERQHGGSKAGEQRSEFDERHGSSR